MVLTRCAGCAPLIDLFFSNFGATLFLYYAEVQAASSEQLQQNLASMIQ